MCFHFIVSKFKARCLAPFGFSFFLWVFWEGWVIAQGDLPPRNEPLPAHTCSSKTKHWLYSKNASSVSAVHDCWFRSCLVHFLFLFSFSFSSSRLSLFFHNCFFFKHLTGKNTGFVYSFNILHFSINFTNVTVQISAYQSAYHNVYRNIISLFNFDIYIYI